MPTEVSAAVQRPVEQLGQASKQMICPIIIMLNHYWRPFDLFSRPKGQKKLGEIISFSSNISEQADEFALVSMC